jgi:hypothetical protein
VNDDTFVKDENSEFDKAMVIVQISLIRTAGKIRYEGFGAMDYPG